MDTTEKNTSEDLCIRIARPTDIELINYLDSFSSSPTRAIHRDVQKYFGSVDPSTHEHTIIFLLELAGKPVAKAELMTPPDGAETAAGYVKRVIVLPDYRGKGYARQLLTYIIEYAQKELNIYAIDLHVFDQNTSAIRLYESLGFTLQHRELYYRLSL